MGIEATDLVKNPLSALELLGVSLSFLLFIYRLLATLFFSWWKAYRMKAQQKVVHEC